MALRRFIPIAAAILFGGNAVDALRFGYADWLFRQGRLEEAVEAAPGNAAYRSDPAEAAQLSPRDASLQVRLGLALEDSGHIIGAERALLDAASLSRKYEPRFALAGFYFRTHRTEPFWFWAGEALSMAPGDPDALFNMAWSFETNGARVRERLRPEARPQVWRHWVLNAARNGRLDELEAVLDRVDGIDPELIAATLVAGGRVRALARLRGHHALDWQAVPQHGVEFLKAGDGFEMNFNGSQPDQCDVAARLLAGPSARKEWPIEGALRGLRWRHESFGDGGRVLLRYERPAGAPAASGRIRVTE